MPVVIREQVGSDAAGVAQVLVRAFTDEPDVAVLEAALARRPDSVGFVAEQDGHLVGHVRLTTGWVDAPERLAEVEILSPLGVDPTHQGMGIGRALVAHALAWAADAQIPAVFLEGDPGYYGRLGWQPAASIGVTTPSERIPAAACQVMRLGAYEPWMRGRLVYPDTFWSYDSVGLRGSVLADVRVAVGEDEAAVTRDVVARERALLDPAVRADPVAVEALLAPDFVEYGASGRVWDRDGIIGALAATPLVGGEAAGFDGRLLSDRVVLVTYRIDGVRPSLRSSVWVQDDTGTWCLRFHQGTPVTH